MASRRRADDDEPPDRDAEVARQVRVADRVVDQHAALFQALADHDRHGDTGDALDFRRLDVVELDGPVAVIGDVHGRADLLARLLERLGDLPIFVVGDVCDRGPDTRGVLDLLVARGARGVRGNHEEWLCAYAAGQGFDTLALNPLFGGEATLRSYGITGRTAREIEGQRWRIPREHRDWLARLPVAMRLVVGGAPFWLAHAGVAASLCAGLDPLPRMHDVARTQHHDLLWRSQGVEDMDTLDGPVVFGHVPRAEPIDAGHAIGIDTGSGPSDDAALSAVLLPSRRFVTVLSR